MLQQLGEEPAHPGIDVIADQTHTLQTLDATLGRLVSHPPLARPGGVVGKLQLGITSQDDHAVNLAQQLWIYTLRVACGHVGTGLGDDLDGLGLSFVPGLVPAEWISIRSPACLAARAAAIWDLPPLPTQTNRTVGWVLMR